MRVTITSSRRFHITRSVGGWIFIRSLARRDDERRDVLSERECVALRFNSSERVLIFDNDFQGYALAITLCAGTRSAIAHFSLSSRWLLISVARMRHEMTSRERVVSLFLFSLSLSLFRLDMNFPWLRDNKYSIFASDGAALWKGHALLP